MKTAMVARPPVWGGKVKSFDAAAALEVPGVERVIHIPEPPIPAGFNTLGGVAVVAKNTWAAIKGREALEDRLGRRPERGLRLRRVQGDARGVGAQARASRAHARRTPRRA